MSRSDETIYRQWIMLTKIPRYPRKITVTALKKILLGDGYDINTRTIQRDLNKLSSTFPLSNDSEGRVNHWFWSEDAAIQDLPGMEPATALTFKMAESYLIPLLPKATLDLLQPYFKCANEVLNKDSSSLLQSWSDKVAVIERGPVLKKTTIRPEIQYTVYQALLEEKTILGLYKARNNDKPNEYLIHPMGIVSRAGIIYLICTLKDYNDIRQLALHRFVEAKITDTPIKDSLDFSLQNYVENEHNLSYPQSNELIQLEVLFDERTASHLLETPLSEKQTLTIQPDGRYLLTAEVIDTLELRWWLQAFGDNVEVLKPTAMRKKFKAVAEQFSLIYK